MQPPAEFNDEPPCCCASEKRIVLVGASVRAAAQSAGRAGFCVTGVDLFGDTDTREACHRHFLFKREDDVDQIVRACRGVRVMRVGGLRSSNLLTRRLAETSPLIGPSDLVCDPLRDPAHLRDLALHAGMHFPPTLNLSTSLSGGSDDPEGRWLRKRRDSCGGLGVRWHSNHQRVSNDQFLQKWIPGRSHGATLISDGSRARLLGVCRSLFTRRPPRPFLYAGSMGPIGVSPGVSRSLRNLGQQVVARTKLRGLFNVDFVVDRSGVAWLLEINPRWSGSSELIERSLIDQHRLIGKESLLALSVDALGFAAARPDVPTRTPFPRPPTPTNRSPIYLKRVVFAGVDMRFERTRFTRLMGDNESLHDVPHDGTLIHRGDPAFTVITAIDPTAIDPMVRHRVLLREINAAIKRCRADGYSPRSSAYE